MDDHRKCVAEGDCRPPHKSRKDRSRWCRGKPGVEHQWQWVNAADLPNTFHVGGKQKRLRGERLGYRYERRVCSECGKQHYETRRVCHCGAVFVTQETGRYRYYGRGHCPTCGYMLDWRESQWRTFRAKSGRMESQLISGPYKPPCRCEG